MTKRRPASQLDPSAYRRRSYRERMRRGTLAAFRVVVKETDLHIQAESVLADEARELVLQHRGLIERYIHQHPGFATALTPWHDEAFQPAVVRDMIRAAHTTGVGPMAAVAGALAEHVARGLTAHSTQVIVENGGDLFLQVTGEATVAVFAGQSPLSERIGLRIPAQETPLAVCTSSGRIGHSLSLGSADAVCVAARSGALADAAATALGNRVGSRVDLAAVVDAARKIPGLLGVLVIRDRAMALWGRFEVVRLTARG